MRHAQWIGLLGLGSLLATSAALAEDDSDSAIMVPSSSGEQSGPHIIPVVTSPTPPQAYGTPIQPEQPTPPRSTVDTRIRASNSIFVEGLGAGLFYSLNYERLVLPDLGVRVGFSYLSLSAEASSSSSDVSYLAVPITVNYLGIGSQRSIFELGGGITFTYVTGSSTAGITSAEGSGLVPLGTLHAGWRLHPVDGAGFMFRVGAMALIGEGLGFDPEAGSIGALPYFYVSLGGSFGG